MRPACASTHTQAGGSRYLLEHLRVRDDGVFDDFGEALIEFALR
jgi:hypothetical protein